MEMIRSLMKTNMVTVAPEETVAEAARSISQNGVGALLVIAEERLEGILSERDVVSRVVAPGKDPALVRVADVSTRDVIAVEATVSVRECAELLRKHAIRHLPVLEAGRPVGILSSRDFFDHVAAGLEKLVAQAHYEEKLAEGEDPYDHIGGSYGK